MNLITGGTGTLGSELVRQLKDVIVFSRNELTQVKMRSEYPHAKYVIGDIRDIYSLEKVMPVNKIYHLAALKHIDICEQNPTEAVLTNINGIINVVNLTIKYKCKLVFISTDKAVNPTTTYGMTKKIGEEIAKDFTIVRSGNIFGSSGSVVPVVREHLAKTGEVNLMDPSMERMFVTVENLAKFMIEVSDTSGVYFPEMFGVSIKDLVEVIANGAKINVLGRRKGEAQKEFIVSNENYKKFKSGYTITGPGNSIYDPELISKNEIKDHLRTIREK